MKYFTTDQIRQMFLDFFASKDHMIEPGAPLVPKNDPTLLWINSGVAALKKYFDGSVQPAKPRIANAQKSIRTNDIDNVGLTARHHTFFEMLGNFSIGDYFKAEAIAYAWEFLTSKKWLAFDPEKLYITVHSDDEVAYHIWLNDIGVPATRILKTPDNFWQIGEGPCGPNSEIFYDRGAKYDPAKLGEKLFFEELENDRYIEIWNIVFSQYDAKAGLDRSEYPELPQKNIDTGLGLERLACVVQEVETNYDIDIFQPLIKAIEKVAKYPYQNNYQIAYRVIADHMRTIVFALGDGALFSNESRGYVLRRLLRRAVRYGKKLGIETEFLTNLVPIVTQSMATFYPTLAKQNELMTRLVAQEEERFHTTLQAGEKLLAEVISELKTTVIPGDIVFKLYDTYGFPWELTAEIAQEQDLTIDQAGFELAMQDQKQRAREAREAIDSMGSQSSDLLHFTAPYKFLGYQALTTSATVTGIFQAGKLVSSLTDAGQIAFDQSVFYAESGGQVADTGRIYQADCELIVTDVQKATNGQALHQVQVLKGEVKIGDQLTLEVDQARRQKIKANHSSVHLLQHALREVLGKHVTQAGSFVTAEYSRFDFNHYERVTAEQLSEIEQRVNQAIFTNYQVEVQLMSLAEARQHGAMALFEDKYQDQVRVIGMGDSLELCGGTHVSQTAEIGVYRIISEESIGSGIRRITAVSQMLAYQALKQPAQELTTIQQLLKQTSTQDLPNKIEALIAENHQLVKQLEKGRQQELVSLARLLNAKFQTVNQLNILVTMVQNYQSGDLKQIVDELKNRQPNYLIVLASKLAERVDLVVASSEVAIKAGYPAGQLVKDLALALDGKGGGRPDLAQGAGISVAKLNPTLLKLSEKLGFDY